MKMGGLYVSSFGDVPRGVSCFPEPPKSRTMDAADMFSNDSRLETSNVYVNPCYVCDNIIMSFINTCEAIMMT